jgi:nitroreductase
MQHFDLLDDLLKARFSCRGFKPDPVKTETIQQIVTAAGRAPSWCNAQPWHLTITQREATARFRAALQEHIGQGAPQFDIEAPASYPGVYGERRRACGWQLYDAVGVTKGDRQASTQQMMRNFALFDAPHTAIVSSPRDLAAYGAMDCGGFVTAFMLAAKALGVDSIAQAAVASYSGFVRDHFDISEDRLILCAISFGYADTTHPANGFRTGRAEAAELIDWKS